MNTQDFSATILVDQTPKEAFDAILNIGGWWSANIEGDTHQIGDVFSYSAKKLHRCSMKLVELIPRKKAVWDVLDNYFSFTQDQNEWTDTKIRFDIAGEEGKTTVTFTHVGLKPGFECYDICSNAWTFYITESLRDLIVTGKGQPNEKECVEQA